MACSGAPCRVAGRWKLDRTGRRPLAALPDRWRGASCALGSGRDGANPGSISWGESLLWHLRGAKLSGWRRIRGPGEGHLGKIGLLLAEPSGIAAGAAVGA